MEAILGKALYDHIISKRVDLSGRGYVRPVKTKKENNCLQDTEAESKK
jgi:hypothetical protein